AVRVMRIPNQGDARLNAHGAAGATGVAVELVSCELERGGGRNRREGKRSFAVLAVRCSALNFDLRIRLAADARRGGGHVVGCGSGDGEGMRGGVEGPTGNRIAG